MITHYLFFRYEPGFLNDDVIREMTEVFEHVCHDVDGAESFVIDRNTVSRPNSMDIMVTLFFRDEKAMGEYINHPDHIDISTRYEPHISSMFSFDKKS